MEVSGQFHAPAALLQGTSDPGTHRMEGWVSPIEGLDAATKRKKFLPLPGTESQSSSPQFSHYADWATPDLPRFPSWTSPNECCKNKKWEHNEEVINSRPKLNNECRWNLIMRSHNV
jgi:hypothetical protein